MSGNTKWYIEKTLKSALWEETEYNKHYGLYKTAYHVLHASPQMNPLVLQ